MLTTAAYIHIPFCRQRCFYCDFPVTVVGQGALTLDGWIGDYVEAVCREIQGWSSEGPPLETVFFGGGTPSLLPIAGLEKILNTLETRWGLASGVEISMEVDPGTFDSKQIQRYSALGVNRLSLGVQTFDDDLLAQCGRHHRRPDIDQALSALAQGPIPNWSLDLISGLPSQTFDQWQQSLTLAIAAGPRHLSCYDLVLEPQTVFDRWETQGRLNLPPEDHCAQSYRQAQQFLTAQGWHHYEISNYAQPGYECRHNLTYWRNQPYYGFGLGATSYIQGQRFSRPRTRQGYYQWLENWIQSGSPAPGSPTAPLDHLLETLMVGLRLTQGLTWADLPPVSPEQKQVLMQTLLPFCAQGWVEFFPKIDVNSPVAPTAIQGFRLTDPEGMLYSNQVISTLFATF